MTTSQLGGKTVLISGAAKRIGRALALACAHSGANVVIHYNRSAPEALQLQREIQEIGPQAWTVQADLESPRQIAQLAEQIRSIPLFALINNASIFEPLTVEETTPAEWDRHMAINLRAPFLLSQAFAAQLPPGESGRIVNMLDWRALRAGSDHFPYTVSKAGLAALTRILARAFAPAITVNGLALGAILPPQQAGENQHILDDIPVHKWGDTGDVSRAVLYLLVEAGYMTGQIIHIDGGRHLV